MCCNSLSTASWSHPEEVLLSSLCLKASSNCLQKAVDKLLQHTLRVITTIISIPNQFLWLTGRYVSDKNFIFWDNSWYSLKLLQEAVDKLLQHTLRYRATIIIEPHLLFLTNWIVFSVKTSFFKTVHDLFRYLPSGSSWPAVPAHPRMQNNTKCIFQANIWVLPNTYFRWNLITSKYLCRKKFMFKGSELAMCIAHRGKNESQKKMAGNEIWKRDGAIRFDV